jgi:hypothetical protein
VNFGKLRGFSAKLLGPTRFDRLDSSLLNLDPLDLDLTAVIVRS